MVEGVQVFFSRCVLSTVPASMYLVWKISPSSECHVFFGKLLYGLTLDQHCRCFSVQGEGAADLLGALGRSQELEAVEFDWCHQIPAAAWHCVPSGAWPKLRHSWGIPDEEERRLRGDAVE